MKLLCTGERVSIGTRGIRTGWLHALNALKVQNYLSAGFPRVARNGLLSGADAGRQEQLLNAPSARTNHFTDENVEVAGKRSWPDLFRRLPERPRLRKSRAAMLSTAMLSVALASCGGGGGDSGTSTQTNPPPAAKYTVGGSVSGLSGTGLVLQNNGGDNLTVTANGAFTFATSISAGASYSVTVSTQPSGPAQTCTVTNGTGMANANVTNVGIACTTNAAANVTVGGTVSGLSGTGLVLQDNGGDSLPVTANGTFVFATSLAAGAAYAVTVSTQPSSPNQKCVVNSGAGTVAGVNVTTVAVICRTKGQFAYTANNQGGTVSAYTIDPSSGALTSSGPAVADGTLPAAVSLAPNGKFAFSASNSGKVIYAFTVDPTTGALTAVAGSPFATPFVNGHPYPDIAVDSQSKFLYLASLNDAQVAGFAIDGTTGVLTPVPGSPFAAHAGAGAIPAFSPDGKSLYVMNQTANSVEAYSINATTGSLTAITGSPFASGTTPTWISFTPNGKFAYVSNSGSANVSAYSVDSTGALTALSGSPYATETYPADNTIDSTGTHLYVPNKSSASISVFSIDATTGLLTQVTGSPFAAGQGPTLVLIEPNGKFAYASSSAGSDVYGYSIDPTTGALTAITGSPFAAGTHPLFINIDPSGSFAYTANNGSNDVSGFTIDATTGALTAIGGSPFAAGMAPFVVSISPEFPGFRD